MQQFLHLSDLHNREECIPRLHYIREHYPNHTLLITGDVVNDGRRGQYGLVLSMLEDFDYYVVPGNHGVSTMGIFDHRAKLVEFDKAFFTEYATVDLPRVSSRGDIALIGLNSNPGTWWWFGDFARGKIGTIQRWQLEIDLCENVGKTRIVMLHHHIQKSHLLMELSDADKVIRALQYKSEIVLMGHFHEDEMLDIPGIPLAHAAGAFYNDTEALKITVKDGVVTHRYVPII